MTANAHASVVKLLDQLRNQVLAGNPKMLAKIEDLSYQIETITKGWMAPTPKDVFGGVHLEPLEMRIVSLLYARLGKVVAHESMLNAMYFDKTKHSVAPKTLSVHMCKLRKKLKGYRIEPVHGVGYRMVSRETGISPSYPADDTSPMSNRH